MTDSDTQNVEAPQRRKPDWWALEPALTETKDIVDHLSEATGYFHDDEAAKLRAIAAESSQRPIGVVRAAVEKEIERREWRCAHFESEGRGYIPHNPYEYYRIHEAFRQEYDAAIDELSEEDPVYGRQPNEEFEHAVDKLEDAMRIHEAKAEQAEQYLSESGEPVPEVNAVAE